MGGRNALKDINCPEVRLEPRASGGMTPCSTTAASRSRWSTPSGSGWTTAARQFEIVSSVSLDTTSFHPPGARVTTPSRSNCHMIGSIHATTLRAAFQRQVSDGLGLGVFTSASLGVCGPNLEDEQSKRDETACSSHHDARPLGADRPQNPAHTLCLLAGLGVSSFRRRRRLRGGVCGSRIAPVARTARTDHRPPTWRTDSEQRRLMLDVTSVDA